MNAIGEMTNGNSREGWRRWGGGYKRLRGGEGWAWMGDDVGE